jgi:hypothetical protein
MLSSGRRSRIFTLGDMTNRVLSADFTESTDL